MEELQIISDPRIMVGKPIIKRTRITVQHVLEEMAAGMTIDDMLRKYPQLTREGIQAALKFAAESVRFDHVTPYKNRTQEEDRNSSPS